MEDALGSLLGRLPANAKNNSDSDGDGLSDFVEAVGVANPNGLAGSDGSLHMAWQDADPQVQDLFVEVDYMVVTGAGAHSHLPYGCGTFGNCTPAGTTALGNDMASEFQNDSAWTARTVRPHIEISTAITETPTVGFYSCTNAGYTNFYSYKNNPAFFDPMRASVYHYMIAGHQQRDQFCGVSGSSGIAEILGNDLIMTLGSGFSGSTGSTLQQRGTFVHELGHNLALVHNGNGDNGGANSCVHTSVMNYRYQMAGWGNASTPALRKQAYSRGSCDAVGVGCGNTCTNRCVPNTQTSPKSGCGANNGSCDCDTTEWATLNLNFPRLNDDMTAYHVCSIPSGQCGGAEGFKDYFLGNASKHTSKHRNLASANESTSSITEWLKAATSRSTP